MYRSIQEKAIWKFGTPEQKAVLITILLNVNHEESEWIWKGDKFICKPGQMITSLSSLAEKSGVSVQNVRTALAKFEKFGFLTNESTKSGRLINVVNWAFYQSVEETSTNTETNSQQRTSNELTSNKNNKNNKNIYNVSFEELWKVYPRKVDKAAAYKQYRARLNSGYTEDELFNAVSNYAEECKKERREENYIKHAKTFLGVNTPFVDYLKKGGVDNGEDEREESCADFYARYFKEHGID